MAIDSQQTEITVKTETVLRLAGLVLLFVLLYMLRDVVVIVLIAIFLASALNPLVNWLETKKIPRLLGVLIIYVTFFGIVTVLLSLIVPIVSYELNQLLSSLPKIASSASAAGSSYYSDALKEIQNVLNNLTQFLTLSSKSILNLVIGIFGGVISFLAIVIISFYFSVMKQGVASFIRSILPEKYEDYVVELWARSERKIGRWFQGHLLLAISVGLLVYVGLSLFHLKYALILGIIAMVFEIVPVAGPVLSAIPAVIFAFIQSPVLAIWIIVFYIIVHQIESNVIAPLTLGKATGLSPVVVIIAILAGVKLDGILGIILAVPMAVVIVELFEDLARGKESRKAQVINS
ncbi:MAG: hypothetical protein CEN90_674 [Parcubacteria group bacterium Licking1014_17]|nr:MAG: hypothetical protein CEN90_674 [Parcubacteria group bacterium Licking1014_17]